MCLSVDRVCAYSLALRCEGNELEISKVGAMAISKEIRVIQWVYP